MKNLEQFLSKLNKVDFNKVDGKTIIGNVGKNTINVEIHTELNAFNMPVQLVITVWINNIHGGKWGAVNDSDNVAIANWFKKAETAAFLNEYKLEKELTNKAKEIFNSL